eukprot:COSAG01_NODE_57336_length_313_cov_0.345794_1_plen_20_part_10
MTLLSAELTTDQLVAKSIIM